MSRPLTLIYLFTPFRELSSKEHRLGQFNDHHEYFNPVETYFLKPAALMDRHSIILLSKYASQLYSTQCDPR